MRACSFHLDVTLDGIVAIRGTEKRGWLAEKQNATIVRAKGRNVRRKDVGIASARKQVHPNPSDMDRELSRLAPLPHSGHQMRNVTPPRFQTPTPHISESSPRSCSPDPTHQQHETQPPRAITLNCRQRSSMTLTTEILLLLIQG